MAHECDEDHDPAWDKEEVYDSKIRPLMKEIIAICKEHKIPMMAVFEYTQTHFCSTSLPLREGMSEKIRRAVAIIKGADQIHAFTMITSTKPR